MEKYQFLNSFCLFLTLIVYLKKTCNSAPMPHRLCEINESIQKSFFYLFEVRSKILKRDRIGQPLKWTVVFPNVNSIRNWSILADEITPEHKSSFYFEYKMHSLHTESLDIKPFYHPLITKKRCWLDMYLICIRWICILDELLRARILITFIEKAHLTEKQNRFNLKLSN